MAELPIDPDELVALTLALCNIESPAGQEAEVGAYIHDWMAREGFAPRRIGMFPDRFNVLGILPGRGDGLSLIFNSHMDTGRSKADRWSRRAPDAAIDHGAWVEDGALHGEGVVNDKGPMAAFLIAAKAIKRAGIPLRGDLLLSAVPGEIGYEAVDEFEAPQYLSKEVGTRYLIQHGGVADFALVAEGTDFRYAGIEAGKAFFEITVFGEPQFYTPFVPDAEVDAEHPNAIVRAGLLIPALQRWARDYEKREVYACEHGTIVPKAVIGAIRGGNPYHVTRTSELCALYLDCRLTPDSDPLDIRRELRELLASLNLPGTVELFLYRRSYGAGDTGALLDGLKTAHRAVHGEALALAAPVYSSMWRDVLIFNEMGIPSITYGPPRSFRRQAVAIADLVRCAEVYARLAIDVCSREKPPRTVRARPAVP
ncbi:M20/M25/M40 family metallo-hydrolase [Rhodoplanes sp. TEM]|uniref:M20/M25/M40 family metallo-hydrolase n=1 Tax=Rhodoplanes tepidamans TaxID=200616 RepID=A0ABT5JBT3_RHOTP|nr:MULTISPECIES: M20/M25/M40 family metallo-hydrolase [Rhodoplanes]MDC7787153.1 M20/M25/M40 family metallo-hydrolase [Rhodoplanes tepidamans]MDC7984283.1 M20/M25/M40 family metallo-hydrolase [Rhodoplanes sp. TEM]MDQ0356080.1 acetylornithine deacetylase/succinyl-diaminopimelate desuccinylase-like protein [Rhodoplanes tepidamans]